jgi:hypothetical protein
MYFLPGVVFFTQWSHSRLCSVQGLVGARNLPGSYNAQLKRWKRTGTTMKVLLALTGLPKFTCMAGVTTKSEENAQGHLGTTIHIIPQEEPIAAVRKAYEQSEKGILRYLLFLAMLSLLCCR